MLINVGFLTNVGDFSFETSQDWVVQPSNKIKCQLKGLNLFEVCATQYMTLMLLRRILTFFL